jgi:hypothetical protein
MGQQYRRAIKQHGINPRAAAIGLARHWALPVSFDAKIFHHTAPLVLRALTYI